MSPYENQNPILAIDLPTMGGSTVPKASTSKPQTAAQNEKTAKVRVKASSDSLDLIYLADAISALLLAVVTLPVLLLSLLWVLAVTWDNPFFVQVRIGLDSRPYRLFKVRTMRRDTKGHARFCAHGDDRIIPGGHLLRQSRIDELPQLLNVFRGDMALVGPRPEQPTFVQSFLKEIPRYGERLSVRPGITGLAQVNQGYVDSLRGTQIKLRYDLFFIQKRSMKLWCFVLLRTFRVVIFRHGAR